MPPIKACEELVDVKKKGNSAEPNKADPAYKQMLVDCSVEDLVVSAAITGTPASWLKPSLRKAGLDPDQLPDAPGRSYDSNQSFAGKRWMDVWAAGQGLGASHQTGWTGVIARILHLFATLTPDHVMGVGMGAIFEKQPQTPVAVPAGSA